MSEPIDTSPKAMRQFGLVTGLLIIVLVGGLLPWLWERDILQWQRITAPIGGVLILWAWLHPASLTLIYKPWMFLAEKVGWVNTRIIILLLFCLVIFPIGFAMRLFGKDPMARHYSRDAKSYRIVKQPQPKDHMETPF